MKIPFLTTIRKYVYVLCLYVDKIFNRSTNIVIFNMHSVTSESNWKYSNSLADLEYFLSTMTSIGYTPVPLSHIVDYIENGSPIPKRAYTLTFDDGYKNIMSARPILSKYKVQPTVFVLSRPASADRNQIEPSLQLLTPKEVSILSREGWGVGVHSRTHADFSRLSNNDLEKEIVYSRKEFNKLYSMPGEYFAYPKGVYNSKITEYAKKAKYRAAFTMDNMQIVKGMDVYSIPRVGIDHTHSRAEFRSLFSPTAMALKRLLARTGVWNLW